ncbi:enhancer of split malpha protein [Calliphora vicina]|uniref:enhancer of split malpha protein n=1 Tax=Calliphora vicina TaxID=7373 RepID=UPI00325A5486
MCQQMQQLANSNATTNNKKTYSIKKVLKTFFKKQQKTSSTETFEDLDNLRNMQAEQQQYFSEMEDNSANEKLSVMAYDEQEQDDQEDIYVPVRFARTEAGTFFWTTNLQPVTSTIQPAVDEDLLQPAYCYSNNQYPIMQFQDRWAQA